MNYYEHHINDYAEATSHLTFVEDAAYSRCLRKYYAKEAPLPADIKQVQRLVGCRTPDDRAAVETVLREFFVLMPDGWHQEKCDDVIAAYQAGEPERDQRRQAKQQGADTRVQRHRDERARLFAALGDVGHRPPWNSKMKTLRELFQTYCAERPVTPPVTRTETAPVTQPDTPATATVTASNAPLTASHSPLPNNQYPGVTGGPSEPIENNQSGAVLLTAPATPETRRAADSNASDHREEPASGQTEGDKPIPPATAPVTPETLQVGGSAMAVALRNARVSVTSDDSTLQAWIQDGITIEQLLEAVAVTRLRPDKAEGVIPAKYLDPIVREQRAKAAAPAPTRRQETPSEREWRLLRADASSSGYHREPGPNETVAQYRAAFVKFEQAKAAEVTERLNASLKAMAQ